MVAHSCRRSDPPRCLRGAGHLWSALVYQSEGKSGDCGAEPPAYAGSCLESDRRCAVFRGSGEGPAVSLSSALDKELMGCDAGSTAHQEVHLNGLEFQPGGGEQVGDDVAFDGLACTVGKNP